MIEPLLNPAQSRAVFITLRETEIVLRRALVDLHQRDAGRLYDRYTTASDKQLALISQLIDSILREVTGLADILELGTQRQDPLTELPGIAASLWSSLIDLHGEKLYRYGDVNPAAIEVLNPPLGRCAALLNELMHALTRESQS